MNITLSPVFALLLCAGAALAATSEPTPSSTIRERLARLALSPEAIDEISEEQLRTYDRFTGMIDYSVMAKEVLDDHQPLCDVLAMECELAWYLDVISFEDAVHCLSQPEVSSCMPTNAKLLVNVFGDRHAFELSKLTESGVLLVEPEEDVDMYRHAREMVKLGGFILTTTMPAFFRQHAVRLYLRNACDDRKLALRHLMTLHLSAFAAEFGTGSVKHLRGRSANVSMDGMLSQLYGRLKYEQPTLFISKLPNHAAAVMVNRSFDDTHTVEMINSGDGLDHHSHEIITNFKGFHASRMTRIGFLYNPVKQFDRVTSEQLAEAGFHCAEMEKAYYIGNSDIQKPGDTAQMPWELTDSQGIGSCAASSIWFVLRFRLKLVLFETELRLSMLSQAVSELVDLHPPRLAALEDLQRAQLQKEASLRGEIVAVALNELLQNTVRLHHELHDVNEILAKKKWVRKGALAKLRGRKAQLEQSIPRVMAAFHLFWKAHTVDPSESWSIIRHDVASMYRDTVRLIEKRTIGDLQKEVAISAKGVQDVTDMPIHEALKTVLNAILMWGDSLELRRAIDLLFAKKAAPALKRHLQYLVVLYAAMRKLDTLLSHLSATKGLPLSFRFMAYAPTQVMLVDDVWTAQDISLLAGHEFRAYGQPLDAFPQVLLLKQSPSIASLCKKLLGKAIVKDADVAFREFVASGQIALAACLLPRASTAAVKESIRSTKDLAVLQLLAPTMSREDIENGMHAAIARDDAKTVAFFVPLFQKDAGLTAEATRHTLAHDERTDIAFLKVIDRALSFLGIDDLFNTAVELGHLNAIKALIWHVSGRAVSKGLLTAIDLGNKNVAFYLSLAVPDKVPYSISTAIQKGHFDIAEMLVTLHPSQTVRERAFIEYARAGYYEQMRNLLDSVGSNAIFSIAESHITAHKYAIAAELLQHAPLEDVDYAAYLLSCDQPPSKLFYEIIDMATSKRREYLLTLSAAAGRVEVVRFLAPSATSNAIYASFADASTEGNAGVIAALAPYMYSRGGHFERRFEGAFAADNADLLKVLIERIPRRVLLAIDQSVLKERSKDVQELIGRWIETQLPIDIRFEYAICVATSSHCTSLKSEAARLGIDLPVHKLAKQYSKEIEELGPKASAGAIEEAFRDLDYHADAEMDLLMPFATTYACDALLQEGIRESHLEGSMLKCISRASAHTVLDLALHAFRQANEPLLAELLPKLPAYGGWRLLEHAKDLDAPAVSLLHDKLDRGQIALVVFYAVNKRSLPILKRFVDRAPKSAIDRGLILAARLGFDDARSILEAHAGDDARQFAKRLVSALAKPILSS